MSPALRGALAMAGVVGVAAAAGRFIPDIPPREIPGYAVAGVLLAAAFVRPYWGLVLLTFAMLLSPQGSLAETGGHAVTLRMDDLFVACLGVGWLGHCAVVRETPLIPGTAFTIPMGWYLAIALLATFRGTVMGWVNPIQSWFNIVKFAEYFLLMFLTVLIARTERQAKVLLWCGLLTALTVMALGWQMYLRWGDVGAPFQEHREGATYGAYMILVIGLLGGLALESRLRVKLTLAALLVASFPPFVGTASRASYMGVAVCGVTLLAIARQGRGWLVPLLAAGAAFLILNPPPQVKQKMESTFTGARGTFFGHDVYTDESVSERLVRYENVMKAWIKHPILGYGITGPAAVEGIYIGELGQMGVLGLGAFLTIAWRILRFGWQIRCGPHPPWMRGLGQGLVAAYAGLMGHALTANTFHLIRVMEPLMLVIGLLLVLQRATGPTGGAAPVPA